MYTQPRFFIWKPVLPQQMYVSPKTLMPAPISINNYNRYGFPHIPAAPMHHPSYMFAVPTTKANNYPYQAVKDMADKRKHGNFHHITIINAVIPKPYFPPPTPSTQHLQKTLRKYRNNKQLYHQYFNTQHPGSARHNENVSRIPVISQHQNLVTQHLPMHGIAPTAAIDKKSTHMLNIIKQHHEDNVDIDKNSNVLQCGRQSTDTLMQGSSNNLRYLCALFGNHQNATQQKEGQIQSQTNNQQNMVILSTLAPTAPSATTTTSVKPLRLDTYTTQKSIFLPTPVNFILPQTTVAAAALNSATFLPLKQNVEIVSNFSPTRNDAQQHSFFTIEDAITKAPAVSHIFNDPYEAYRHARKRQQHYHKPQKKYKPIPNTTARSLFTDFFDDNIYDNSETQHVDDYSVIGNYDENRSPISQFHYRNEHVRPNRTKYIYDNFGLNLTDPEPVLLNSHQYKSINTEKHINTTPYNYMRTVKSTSAVPTSNENLNEETTTMEPKQLSSHDTATTTYTDKDESHVDKNYIRTAKSTTVVPPPNIFEIFNGTMTTTTMETKQTYTTPYANKDERQAIPTSETHKYKKVLLLKRPYHPTPTSAFKFQKPVRGLFKPYNNTTNFSVTTSTTSSPVTKKKQKYHRQYTSKKNKHIKYASTQSSILSTRSLQTTSTIETITPNRMKLHAASSSESSIKAQNVKVQTKRKLTSHSRNTKRLQGPNSAEKTGTSPTTKSKEKSKNTRRRSHHATAAAKTTPTTSLNTQAASTTKIVRVDSESRTKPSKTIDPNEVYDDSSFTVNNSKSLKLSPTKDGSVPPLPIEIYFKKSHNAKI